MADYTYEVVPHKRVTKYLRKVKEKPLRLLLLTAIAALEKRPHQQGHWLNEPLEGYKALDNLSYQGTQYRIIFRCDDNAREVLVEDLGTHEEYNRRTKTGF